MQFDPKSEREIQDAMCLPAGEYDFECVFAESKESSSGKDMIAMKHKVFTETGAARFVRDWLVASDHPGCQAKVRHFCASTDMLDAYESGSLDAAYCTGRAGRLKLVIKDDPKYGVQNSVADYIVPKPASDAPAQDFGMPSGSQQKAAKEALMPDDASIPF